MVLTRVNFGGDSATGDNVKATTDEWIRFRFPRPVARQANNGEHPFIVKNVCFKMGGDGADRKMYGRVGYYDGSPYGNSASRTAAKATSANKAMSFSGLHFGLTDSVGGDKMSAYLIGSGKFYFAMNSKTAGATAVDSHGKSFKGSPAGYIEYTQVPDAPIGLIANRDTDDLSAVSVAWNAPADDGGAAVIGYRLEMALDPQFSTGLKVWDQAATGVKVTGTDVTKTYYFRVAAKNEVTTQFKIDDGGVWTAAVPVANSSDPAVAIPDDNGTDLIPYEYVKTTTFGAPLTLNPARGTVMQAFSRSNVTDYIYVSQALGVKTDAKTVKDRYADADEGYQTTIISRLTPAGLFLDSMTLRNAGHGTGLQVQSDTAPANWTDAAGASPSGSVDWLWLNMDPVGGGSATRHDVVRIPYRAGVYTRDQAASHGLQKMALASQFFTSTADVVYPMFDLVNGWAAFAISHSGGARTYQRYPLTDVLQGSTANLHGTIAVPDGDNINATLQGFATYGESLFIYFGLSSQPGSGLRGPVPANPGRIVEYSWRSGKVLNTVDVSALGKNADGSYPAGKWEPEGISLYDPGVGQTPQLFAGVVTSTSWGAPYSYRMWPLPLHTQAEARANFLAANPGGADQDAVGPAYTPIPDTSGTETKFGGLLLSSSPAKGETVVMLADRGGMTRIGTFKDLTRIRWGRVRDDISSASISMTGPTAAGVNAWLLKQTRTARRELIIFRGGERVWEGPVTLVQYAKSGVTIQAQDVLWYASRTVMRNAYSNAYPNLDFAVARIAGILTLELARKESLDPPINVLPFLHTYIEADDAKTSRVTAEATQTVWQHLDDLAATGGIDYTAVGRAIHIADTSKAALGRIRVLTEQDFAGDVYIGEYGSDLATSYTVSDGMGGHATAGVPFDDFYGDIELLVTAYDSTGALVTDQKTGTVTTTLTESDLQDQANRGIVGRNPTPLVLHVPDNSSFRLDRGVGVDVLVPGVFVPVVATLSGITVKQTLKLMKMEVVVDNTGETCSIQLTAANAFGDSTTGDTTANEGEVSA